MKTEQADNYRDSIVALLRSEKLPVEDLPLTLENFAVTKQGDEVVGVVGLEIYGGYGLLRSLAISKVVRGKGLAGNLLEWAENLATSKNLKAIYLLTETAPGYFLKKGFTTITRADVPAEVQQSTEFAHVCPQSAIVMVKTIS